MNKSLSFVQRIRLLGACSGNIPMRAKLTCPTIFGLPLIYLQPLY